MSEPTQETFFPGVRKGLHVDHFAPLATKAGEKRIRIDFTMSLADGQLLGLPEWLTGCVRQVQQVVGGSKKDVSSTELDGVTIHCFPTPSADKEAISIPATLLKNFTVVRTSKSKPSGEVADVELTFQAYVSWNPGVWTWLIKYFNNNTYASFGTTQATINYGVEPKAATKAEAAKKDQAARQGSLLEQVPAEPAAAPAGATFDTRFADVKEGASFYREGEGSAVWTKVSPTHAVAAKDPSTRKLFAKDVLVAPTNTRPEPLPRTGKSAAANDDTDQEVDEYGLTAEDHRLSMEEPLEVDVDGLEDDEDLDDSDDEESDDGLEDDGDGLSDDEESETDVEKPLDPPASSPPAPAKKTPAKKAPAKKATAKRAPGKRVPAKKAGTPSHLVN